jgi:hypothetical protein
MLGLLLTSNKNWWNVCVCKDIQHSKLVQWVCVCKDIQHSKLVQWVCVCKDIQHSRLVQWVCCLQRHSTFKTCEMGETTKTFSIQNLCDGVRLKRHSTFKTVGSDVFCQYRFHVILCLLGRFSPLEHCSCQALDHSKKTNPSLSF